VGKGYAGVECLSGIPGLVGATPIQNVGAYGQEVKETIEEVKAIRRSTLAEEHFQISIVNFHTAKADLKRGQRQLHHYLRNIPSEKERQAGDQLSRSKKNCRGVDPAFNASRWKGIPGSSAQCRTLPAQKEIDGDRFE